MITLVDRVAGIAALLGGILLAIAGWRLDPGTPKLPGPGFWPLLIALALSGLGIRLLLHPKTEETLTRNASSQWKSFGIALLSIIGYAAVLNDVGYLGSTFALLTIQLRWVEKQNWRTSLVTAIIASVASLIVFRALLKVPLPVGIFPLPKGW